MMQEHLNELKSKYQEGYRCIHKDTSNGCTYTLRNFDRGKIHTITSDNRMEIGEMDNFLDGLNRVKKQTGHDCICTGYECDE